MRIVLLGGAGFIGAELAQILSAERNNLEIVIVGRAPTPKFPIPQRLQYCAGDVGDELFIREVLSGADMVVDLTYATTPGTSYRDPLSEIEANLRTSVNLLKRASEVNLQKYLLVSSGGTVYGNTKESKISEGHPTNPVSPYGIAKLTLEKFAIFFFHEKKLPLLIVRPSNPYGPNQLNAHDQGFIGKCIGNIFLHKKPVAIYGEFGTVRDYIHVTDLAKAISSCLFSDITGETFNVGTGIGHSNMGVLEVIKKLRPAVNFEVNFLPYRNIDVQYNVLSCIKIRDKVGWEPNISIETGISQLITLAEDLSG